MTRGRQAVRRVIAAVAAASALLAAAVVARQHDLVRRGYRWLESVWYDQLVAGYERIPADSASGVPAYLEVLPRSEIRGLLILVNGVPGGRPSWGETVKLHGLAARAGIMTVYVAAGERHADMLLGEETLVALDAAVTDVVRRRELAVPVVIGGHSLDGTLAVKYAERCAAGQCMGGRSLIGVFAVDAPLDFERFWHMCRRATERGFHPDPVGECRWVLERMRHVFGGAPEVSREDYRRISPFLYSEPGGGNISLLVRTAFRFYTEPDIDWYLENRAKDYYDMNATDGAAVVNLLRLAGNTRADLIASRDRGYFWGFGARHPHAWQIIEERDLVSWMRDLVDGAGGRSPP